MTDKIGEKWKDGGIDCFILDEFVLASPNNKLNEHTDNKCLGMSIESKDGTARQENEGSAVTKVIVVIIEQFAR